MTFDEILVQVTELLQRQGRVSYGALKRRFALDDDYLQDLKDELIDAQRVAGDEDGKVLVWVGASLIPGSTFQVSGSPPPAPSPQTLDARGQTLDSARPEAERRQLTVMFCDLVDSTILSTLLDPEELREVVRAYHQTCAGAISRYGGHTAQHLGDGLLVYFGYPAAHEDDAQRAVRTGLEILTGLSPLNAQLPSTIRARLPHPIQVRIGIHTGLVVIGELGSSEKREILALGETPNIAARVQGQAEPDTVVISAATFHLTEGLFECEDRGRPALKGVVTPLTLYHVLKEGEAQSRFQVVARKGLTPLVGRDHEYGLLRERWERVKDGTGQVVLLSGEPGIGKSRLVEALKETVEHEGASCLELRCSPYTQNSALYPVIEHLQRMLEIPNGDSPEEKLQKLIVGAHGRAPLQQAIPLLATLLSLPHPDGYPVPTLSPQKQKEKTHEALVAWLCEEGRQHAVTYAWEDLHWADPSTLELLTLFLAQAPTTRLLAVLTFRPEFTPPWGSHSYLSQLTLSRLGRTQVEMMVERVTGGKALPKEVVQQIASKTDGVPLFVEELTKMVVETMREQGTGNGKQEGKIVGTQPAAPMSALGIPATLQDALMARLDRLGDAKEIAQLGATLGREFSYDLLHAVSPLDETTLQQRLRQLVEAELVYQSGVPPRTRYLFKHALVQDTAYQSLLKSRRQQLHQQVARILEGQFPDLQETQPELLAHHYTEAGLTEQAIPYWQRAGQRASKRSANLEAISHLTKGLELLKTLPDTPEHTQQELSLQLALGVPLRATKGYGAPEVKQTYTRARELCQRLGEIPQLFPALWGLRYFYFIRAELQIARELGQELLSLAQRVQDPALLVQAHFALGSTLLVRGELPPARALLEQGVALYDPLQHRSHALLYSQDPKVASLSIAAHLLWLLGYPDQALKSSHDALTLAQELSHPFSLAFALIGAARLHQWRREGQMTQEWAEAAITLSTDQAFSPWLVQGAMRRGWALAKQGQGEEGIVQIRQGLAAARTIGQELGGPAFLAMLAEAYGSVGQPEEGLAALAEALILVDRTGERVDEADLYRLKGELTLQKGARGWGLGTSSSSPQAPSLKPQVPKVAEEEAEGYFLKAIEIARKQQAKSLELRAVMSLACLWQYQGKRDEARHMLAEIYGWFTEGFDTKDLQEAKALLEELSH